jgi:hypothetical protein
VTEPSGDAGEILFCSHHWLPQIRRISTSTVTGLGGVDAKKGEDEEAFAAKVEESTGLEFLSS